MCTETSAKDLFKMAKLLHHPQSGKEPNYENAIKLYLQAAIADTQMGEIYSESYYQAGICSEALKDTEKAFEYFLTAARVRDAIPNALNKVGVYYYNGQSPAEQNYDMAFKFFNRAATKDSVQGVYNTGLCHYKKLITNSSDSEAFRFLSIASQKGHITATRLLGLCYENGKGTEADIDKAYECMEKIGDENCYAALWIGNYFKNKDELKNALEWYGKAEQNDYTQSDAKKAINDITNLYIPQCVADYINQSEDACFPDISSLEQKIGTINSETLYDLAIDFEIQGKTVAALKLYSLSAIKGCRKAMYTLSNMSAPSTQYFSSITDLSEAN